ncbi:response regulator transcription factor [Paenibacillus athensensis]|uniref:response regulator transcription factor n=1 Tax=Paenibacillus athensensis TaxID=1967502 RepID=UPI001ADDDF44|nr:response regulator transcription factor [Paenibacillus athensensis]MCD1260161.1 response regulator transcription factor [Paenibacillus athensensis]
MTDQVHILVVEDDDDINRLLCGIVRANGYTQPAYSGTEAQLYLAQRYRSPRKANHSSASSRLSKEVRCLQGSLSFL